MNYRWSILPEQPVFSAGLTAELGVSPLLARCLVNRGVTEPAAAAAFLDPRLKSLRDPFELPGMDQAVNRLIEARRRREEVLVFGDYDVDGVTSSVLLLEVLNALGWKASSYLPHRLEEGYGLSREAVERCLAGRACRLLLAVDCGSTAVDSVAWLASRGVDVIVLDHHQISDPPPGAVALVHPHRIASEGDRARATALGSLCSVGIAFKLAHALVKTGRNLGWSQALAGFDVRDLLDLVALGTIADLVPLHGENRVLTARGLERLNRTRRPGLLALKTVAGLTESIGVYEVGFQLAPRLNAAGRLETATEALDLLRTPGPKEAEDLACQLDARNRERQKIERGIADEVLGHLRTVHDPDRDLAIVEGGMLWHPGVVGIVASRVLKEFHRPTIILGGDAREWRGSGRSIEGFDLAAALRECDDLLIRHGGHALAAGLSIHPDNVDALRERLTRLARQRLSRDQLQPKLRLDARVTLGELSLEQVEAFNRLEPMGQGNPPVHLAVFNVGLSRPVQRMGRERQHARFWINDGTDEHQVVCWNWPESRVPSGRFDVAVAPQINAYNGSCSVQLKLLDWRPASG